MSSGDTTESIEAKPKSALYTRAPTRPRRPRSEARPAEGRKRANVPRRAPPTGRARRLPEAHTMAGRGSAESSRAARPRWVMMEISRVARASAAERSGSSSGACCRRNDKTSDPSRPRASTTKGISSACGFFGQNSLRIEDILLEFSRNPKISGIMFNMFYNIWRNSENFSSKSDQIQ